MVAIKLHVGRKPSAAAGVHIASPIVRGLQDVRCEITTGGG
jgi:hypothetical protein